MSRERSAMELLAEEGVVFETSLLDAFGAEPKIHIRFGSAGFSAEWSPEFGLRPVAFGPERLPLEVRRVAAAEAARRWVKAYGEKR